MAPRGAERAADAPVGVAVVMPAYNAERFVADAVRSVLAQTLADLELLIVDDGSTDRTADVARAQADGRVRVLTVANGGPSRARNVALAAARPSRYVAFLDADDLWDRGKLAAQVALLDARPELVAVGCFMRYVSSSAAVLGETGQALDEGGLASVARGELYPFPTSSIVVRRDVLDALGGFDETLRGSEDLDFIARAAQRGPLACVPEVLGSYRVHPASAMARDRVGINRDARFVRARLAARAAGRELTRAEFEAAHAPGWRERREDTINVLYRSAALWYGEGRWARALGYGALALLAGPGYTLRRLYRQRLGGGGVSG